MTSDLPARFWAKTESRGTCWRWTAATNQGYGRFGLDGKNLLAHRLAWVDRNGPVPDGLELDHLCNNRDCVNPDHLEAVPHEENVRRARERRALCGRGHELPPVVGPCPTCLGENRRKGVRAYRKRHIAAGELVAWDVRTWAWANGFPDLRRRGPLPRAVVDAYLAHTERTAA